MTCVGVSGTIWLRSNKDMSQPTSEPFETDQPDTDDAAIDESIAETLATDFTAEDW